jgi:hypothetical protein
MDRLPRFKRYSPALRSTRMLAALLTLALGGIVVSGIAEARDKKAKEARSMDDLFGGPAASPPKVEKPAATTPESAVKPTVSEPEPRGMDALFGGPALPPPAADQAPVAATVADPAKAEEMPPATKASAPAKAKAAPDSMDALFADEPKQAKPAAATITQPIQDSALMPEKTGPAAGNPSRITGFFQNELGYAYKSPTHWTKFRNILDLSSTGQVGGGISWKLGGRLNYDPIYDLADHYNRAVRDDQRLEAQIREAYIDIPADDWEFRLGRQHVIWGEMVGLFFADVVSAKDLRELALPDFEILRIPQWAARAEYFNGDFHAEAVWIPSMTYDDIGKPGAEFYPFNPPTGVSIAREKRPAGLSESAYGARLSYIKSGWDVSGFLYSTNDPSAAFTRLSPTLYQPIHDRIQQVGATLGKDLGPMVLKAEAVYTKNKLFNVTTPTDVDGLIKQDLLDYIIGLEWSFPQETRFNVQFYQRRFADHDPGLIPDSTESGFSLLFSTQALHPKLEPKLLFIRSLNRNDWLAQFKLTWRQDGNWRLAMGADIFGGVSSGLFGQFDNKDRIYTEVRYNF